MMSYYRITPSIDIAEIGCYDQVQKLHDVYDRWGPNSISKIRSGKKINFDLQLPIFKLEDKAERTDYLSSVFSGNEFMLISPKCLQVFQKLNLDEVQVFPIQVTHKKEILDYFLFYLPNNQEANFVDWTKTYFNLIVPRKVNDFELGKVNFKDFETYLMFQKRFSISNHFIEKKSFKYAALSIETEVAMVIKTLVLNSEINYDLFKLKSVPTGFYASENLKQTVEENKLTGFRFLLLQGNDA